MSMQVSVKSEGTYLTTLLEQARKTTPVVDWVGELRDRATAIVQELSIPTRRNEEWRFTDLSPLLEFEFATPPSKTIEAEAIGGFTLPEATLRLVFVNGVYAPELSSVAEVPEGVFVGNLAALPSEYHTHIQQYLSKQQGDSEVFSALNSAGMTDAAVVWTSRNAVMETPIHLLFVATPQQTPVLHQPRCLVVAQANSQLTFVEHYASPLAIAANQPYFTNQVTEMWLEDNAVVNHIRNQREAKFAFHVGKTAVGQGRNSRYTCTAVSLGAKLSRHNLDVFQTGEGTDTVLNGLTMLGGEQVSDTHSAIALNHPHGTSNQLHKCIVDDRAHAVFNGKVFVPQNAQFTNAAQLNRNLLLSPKARVNTKPQLEITADQVKCSHGATVSQLEADEIFYLQSRGINEADARNLLIDAFVAEIINTIPITSLRQRLSRCVACRTA